MQAREFIIDSKVKRGQFDIVAADDFRTHAGRMLNARVILEQPTVSLYCLDHANQQAIFVETPPDVDLLRQPFYFIAQYDAAQRLIAVPYDTLHMLAASVQIDPRRIILFYSTGRCGSTLLSHVLNLNPSIVSFAEPDVFSQLVMMRTAGQGNDAEIASLLRASAMLMSANAQQQGFEYCAFKFRSYVLSVSDLLYQTIPQAKLLFLYRNALSWARSFSRAFGATDAQLQERIEKLHFRYMVPSVDAWLRTHTRQLSWIEYLAHMWVSTMQDSRRLRQHGAPLSSARFEDLKTMPEGVIRSLLSHCGLPMPDPDQLKEVLAKDSQEGTVGAQDRAEPVRRLTDSELSELSQIICKFDPGLSPDANL